MKRLENSNIEFETSVIEEPKNDDLKKGAIKSDIPKMKTFKHSSVDVDERLQSIIAAAGKKESEEFRKKVNAARESIARIADRRTEIDEEFFPEETSSVVEEGATKTGETSGPEADTPSEEKKEEQKVEKKGMGTSSKILLAIIACVVLIIILLVLSILFICNLSFRQFSTTFPIGKNCRILS